MSDQLSDKDLDALFDDDDCVESNNKWGDDDIAALTALDN